MDFYVEFLILRSNTIGERYIVMLYTDVYRHVDTPSEQTRSLVRTKYFIQGSWVRMQMIHKKMRDC